MHGNPAPRPSRRAKRAERREVALTFIVFAVLWTLAAIAFAHFVLDAYRSAAFFSGGPLPLGLPNEPRW